MSPVPNLSEDAAIHEAIQQALRLFHRTGSTGCPPFWDDFLHFQEEFDELMARSSLLRSLEHLGLCESLEDLLGQVHERWEGIQKIRFCQALLQRPPIRRRSLESDLHQVDPRLLSELLFLMPAWQMGRALSRPPEDGSPWDRLMGLVPMEVQEQLRNEFPGSFVGCRDPSEVQAEALAAFVREFCRMERPLGFPGAWVGRSCLDLRLEATGRWALNGGGVMQHLLTWPEPSDLTNAMVGLSDANRNRLLCEMAPETAEIAWTVVDGSKGLIPWAQVLRAQRRLMRWLDVDFEMSCIGID